MSDEATAAEEARKKKLAEMTLAKELNESETKRIEAETAKLKTEHAKLELQKELEKARAPVDPRLKEQEAKAADAKAAKDAADTKKAEAEASKAAAEAAKAQVETELDTLKARFQVPESPYKGDVTLKDGAGKTEAMLLVAEAVRQVATQITTRPQFKGARKALLVASADVPTFRNLVAFRAQSAVVERAFANAEQLSAQAEEADATQEAASRRKAALAAAPLAAAGVALQSVDRLLGFFRTDFTVGGVDVTTDDGMFVNALAGALTEKGWAITLPKIYNPAVFAVSSSTLIDTLTALSLRKLEDLALAESHRSQATELEAAAGNETDPNKKNELKRIAGLHSAAAKALDKAAAAFDGWFGKLSTADDAKGTIPLAQMLEEEALRQQLTDARSLLVVKLHGAGGSFYTVKNIWTALVLWLPFYHAGGVVASFALIDGATGAVVDAATIPLHGGFVRSPNLPSTLNRAAVNAASS